MANAGSKAAGKFTTVCREPYLAMFVSQYPPSLWQRGHNHGKMAAFMSFSCSKMVSICILMQITLRYWIISFIMECSWTNTHKKPWLLFTDQGQSVLPPNGPLHLIVLWLLNVEAENFIPCDVDMERISVNVLHDLTHGILSSNICTSGPYPLPIGTKHFPAACPKHVGIYQPTIHLLLIFPSSWLCNEC